MYIENIQKKINPSFTSDSKRDGLWFFATILYLIIDYGRPQDLLPIGFIRPALIVSVLLAFFLLKRRFILETNYSQIKTIWFFILLLAVYIPFARNNHYAYQTTMAMLIRMPFILSVIICVNSVDRLRKMIVVLISIMCYVAFYGLTHHGMGSGGYFADENDLSLYINMYLPFCYFLFMVEKKVFYKLLYGGGLVAGLVAIATSFSRGGFIGLLAITLVVWLVSPRKVVSVIIILILAVCMQMYAGDAYWKEMSTISDINESTAQARMESWKAAWRMFLDNPLGVGGNNFQVLFSQYQSEEFFKRGMWGRVSHSIWFTLIPELGIIGIIIYAKLLRSNLKDLFFLKRVDVNNNPDLAYIHALSLAFIASLAGYFATGTFLSVLYYPHYWYLTAFIVVTVKITRDLLSVSLLQQTESEVENNL